MAYLFCRAKNTSFYVIWNRQVKLQTPLQTFLQNLAGTNLIRLFAAQKRLLTASSIQDREHE